MPYEDYNNPTFDDVSVEPVNDRHFEAEEILKFDKNFSKYKKYIGRVWEDGKYYNWVSISNYGSTTGHFARNAVTGIRYDIISGSKNEETLFKVIDVCSIKGRNEPLMLYYYTPEQYENHNFREISGDIKEKWHSRAIESQLKNNRC